jgi:hypothetical protein
MEKLFNCRRIQLVVLLIPYAHCATASSLNTTPQDSVNVMSIPTITA